MTKRHLAAFLRRTFTDVRGNPDGKLLTLCAFSLLALLQYPIGWIWGRWAPDHIWNPTILFLAAGFGIDAYVTRTQIRADAAARCAPDSATNSRYDDETN